MSYASARHQVLQARSAKAADQTQRDIELAQEAATKAAAEARLKLDRTQAQMSLFIEPLLIQASSYISATFYMMADLFPAWTASVAIRKTTLGLADIIGGPAAGMKLLMQAPYFTIPAEALAELEEEERRSDYISWQRTVGVPLVNAMADVLLLHSHLGELIHTRCVRRLRTNLMHTGTYDCRPALQPNGQVCRRSSLFGRT